MADVEDDTLNLVLEDVTRELVLEAANRWFTTANENLLRAGDQLEYDVFPVVQSAQPPQFDDQKNAAEMAWPHRASIFFENGTTEHEVEGDPVLAFEWEEMRGEEFADTGKTFEEVFDDFPTVFLPKVEVDGIPRIGFGESGRQQAMRWLRQQEP